MGRSDPIESRLRSVMSGEARGWRASLMRGALSLAELPYRSATTFRNTLFDRSFKRAHRLDRPVISVGNLTTGGTGKTPAVQWIVRRLQEAGERPVVLMRGYARQAGHAGSDEEVLLRESLDCPVYAAPNRIESGLLALKERPETSVFVLDDGFQHRRLHRDLDLVLVDATQPFGYGHVLPRGMLRESLAGLKRAHAVVLTRADLVAPEAIASIQETIRHQKAELTVLSSCHRLTLDTPCRSLPSFVFSGIGNPRAFEEGLSRAGVTIVGTRRLGDHHPYTSGDVESLQSAASAMGARQLITTAKDWVKVRSVRAESGEERRLPIVVAELTLQFQPADAATLWEFVRAATLQKE